MKKTSISADSYKPDRKTIERNRRIYMNDLCFKLVSLIPPNYLKTSKNMLGQQEKLDIGASYIKHLRERIDKLKGKKEQAMRSYNQTSSKMFNISPKLPVLELRDLGSVIQVMLVSGLSKTFMFYEVVSVLEEEGAEVVTTSFSSVGNKMFYTAHAQVKISRVGVDATIVYQRLQELIATLGAED